MVSLLDSYFEDRGFEPQPNLHLCLFYFYWWIVFIELIRYILKLILNFISNLREICPESCFPRKNLKLSHRYHKLRKTLGKFFRSYCEFLSTFGDISFQEYLSKGISHPVFYGDQVYKLKRVKDTPNFISSGSKIVKRLRRRQYDPVIIERTIGLVLDPSTALYKPFLKQLHSD